MNAKDKIIEKQAAEIQRLKEIIKQLEARIAQLEKDSSNSSKPPSSDIVKPKTPTRKSVRKKRKRGGQFGHRKCSRPAFTPDQVDEVIEYEFTTKDAVGLKPLDEWLTIQQIELPENRYQVIEHRARKYRDPLTGGILIAPIPDRIRKGGLLGVDITAMIALMKGGCHMSYTTIQTFFRELMQLDLSRGMLTKATQKVSASLEPAYQQMADRLPEESYLGIDETGHKNHGDKYWTWCFQTSRYTLFHIDKSRGSQVLFDLLGKAYEGLIGCDFWGAYRKFFRLGNATVQYCMAHLIREIRFLAEQTHRKLSRWGEKLLDWLRALFKTLHRSDELTEMGFARRMTQIQQGFLRQVRRPPDHPLAKKLARRFKGPAAETYFRFLTDPNVEPTNNGTEREIRHTVIDRRITQGTRGDAGMRWCERIWTTIATCKKQNRNVFEFIHHSLIAHWTKNHYPELL